MLIFLNRPMTPPSIGRRPRLPFMPIHPNPCVLAPPVLHLLHLFACTLVREQRCEDVDFSTLALVHVNVGRTLRALRNEVDSAKIRFREASRLAGEVGDDRLKAVCDVLAKEAVSDSTDA